MAAVPQLKGRIGVDGEREFKAAMNGAANSIKLTKSELELLSAQFKAGEGSMEQYQRQQELLTNKLQAQKSQVATMESVLAAVKAKFGENSDQAVRYATTLNKCKAAVAETEGELQKNAAAMEKLEKETEASTTAIEEHGDAAEDANKQHGKLQKAASSAGAVLKGAVVAGAAAAAAALAAVGAAAAKATVDLTNMGTDYQAASNMLSAQTGATGAELQQLSGIAQDVFHNNFGENIGEVNEALAVTKTNTGLMGDELKAATEAGFLLRDTFGFEFQESSRTARTLMKNFGLSADEAYNLIAIGAQRGANQNGDMLDVLAEYGPMYAQMGMSADQMMTSLIKGNEAGVFSIDKVGDAMKEFSIRCVDGSETTKAAMQAIGLDADAMAQQFAMGGENARHAFQTTVEAIMAIEDPVLRSQTAVQMFGTQFEDLGPEILPVLAEMAAGGELTADALGQIAAIRYDDLNNSIEGFSRKVQEQLAPIAQEFSALAKSVVDEATAVLSDGFQPEDVKVIGESLASALVEGISTVQGLMQEAGPVFAETVGVIGNTIAELLPTLIETLLPVATGLLQSLASAITENAESLGDMAASLVESLVMGISEALPELLGAAGTIVGAILGALLEIDWLDVGSNLLQGLVNGLSAAIGGIIESLKTVFSSIIGAIRDILGIHSPSTLTAEMGGFLLDGLLAGLQAAIGGVCEAVKSIFGQVWDAIKSIFGFGRESEESKEAKAAGQEIMTGLKDGIIGSEDDLKDAVKDAAKVALETLKSEFGTLNGSSSETKTIGENLIKGLTGGLDVEASDFEEVARKIFAAFNEAINSAFGVAGTGFLGLGEKRANKFKDIGAQICKGLAEGILNSEDEGLALESAVRGVADACLAAVKTAFGLGDAAGAATDGGIGGSWIASIAAGVTGAQASLTSAGETVATAVHGAVSKILSAAEGTLIGNAWARSIASGITGQRGSVSSAASGLGSAASNALWGAVGAGGSKFTAIGAAIASGVASGISAGQGRITAAATAAARAAYTAACNELEIHSPSRKGRYIGGNYIQSIAMGMDESRQQVTAAAASVARAANSTTQQTLQVQAQAIDYDRIGQSVARANKDAGLGNLALYVGKEKLGQTLEPTVMHAGQMRSRQTVSGRSTRLALV